MKKVPKSLKTIVVTFIVGMFIPKLFDITGIVLLDKVIWKVILTLAFNFSTIVVGFLYAVKLIRGKVDGGKARISIFLIVVIIILCSASSILVFLIKEVGKIVLIIIGIIALFAIGILILNYIFSIKGRKKDFKVSQIESIDKPKTIIGNSNDRSKSRQRDEKKETKQLSDILTLNDSCRRKETAIQLKTVYELWKEFDHSQKCLTITNDENPDLKWVKIYKPPYRNGKFYGYVMMQNAKNTVNGEIYFANRPIWMLYKE